VVKHPCANDLVERLAEFVGALDGEPVDRQVVESVLALQLARERDARLAQVDADDAPTRRAESGGGGAADTRRRAGDDGAAVRQWGAP